jgi:hypothetical protein
MQALKLGGVIATLLVLPLMGVAQDLVLLPGWQKDEGRFLYFTETRKSPAGGDAGSHETQEKSNARVKVYDVTEQSILVSIDQENVVVRAVKPFFDRSMPPELEPYKRMLVRYAIDRVTGATTLLNAGDLQHSARKVSEIALRAMRKNDPGAVEGLETRLGQLMLHFQDPLLVERYFDERLGFLTRAFGKPLRQGEPLELKETQADPFNSGDSVIVVTRFSLEGLDNEAGEAVIRLQQSMAPKPRAPAPARKGAQPARPPATSPERTAPHIKQWEQEETTIMDIRTTWPLRMARNTSHTLGDGTTVTETITVEVR